jgi:uncharacterized membrane protein YqjE
MFTLSCLRTPQGVQLWKALSIAAIAILVVLVLLPAHADASRRWLAVIGILVLLPIVVCVWQIKEAPTGSSPSSRFTGGSTTTTTTAKL